MKIILDVSTTEFSCVVSKLNESAKLVVEKEAQISSLLSQIHRLDGEVFTANRKLQTAEANLKYQEGERSFAENELRSTRALLTIAEEKLRSFTEVDRKKRLDATNATLKDAAMVRTVFSGIWDNKIQMIKKVRELADCGLKEAKDLVEDNWDFVRGCMKVMVPEKAPATDAVG
jgi:ribosomal protein L7/L12